MTSRMDRHDANKNTSSSRLSKNKELYENLYTNSSYTEFTGIKSSNVIDLTSSENKKTSRREDYQRKREFAHTLGNDEDSDFKYSRYSYNQIIEPSMKDYDINIVLENAKKNRSDVDELEKKRKLRTTEYNILADLTEEKLKEHKEKKKEVLSEEEKEELEELIHTITSNTMRQEIDDELLSGLMPTKLDETIIFQDLSEQVMLEDSVDVDVSDSNDGNDDTETTMSKLDDSFYTKSMDLSDQDLIPSYDDGDDEIDDSFKDTTNKKNIVIKCIVALVITILIVGIAIVIYNVI